MSFWNLSEGELDKSGAFETGGGNMEPIPADTQCLAMIDEAKWTHTNNGEEYLSLRWAVISPAEFKNRKVYHKLWVTDADPKAKDPAKKRDKAKRMLAAIDFNAGGKLAASTEAPTDESLTSALTRQPMIIKVMLWTIEDAVTGETKKGNWIGAVNAKSKTAAAVPQQSTTEVPF